MTKRWYFGLDRYRDGVVFENKPALYLLIYKTKAFRY